MMKVRKFLKNTSPDQGVISHEDQEVRNLKFRKIGRTEDNLAEIIVVEGEETEIADYLTRRPSVTEISRADVEATVARYWSKIQPAPAPEAPKPWPLSMTDIDAIEF